MPEVDRFETPLYSVVEAAAYLGVPPSTFHSWARGYTRRSATRERPTHGAPVVTALPAPRRQPSVPFIGLAEGMVLAAIRRQGVPLQRIRPALERLQRELGLAHALASKRLYTDGAEVLYDYSKSADLPGASEAAELVVVRNNQRVFSDVVASYLTRLDFDNEYVTAIRLPAYERGGVLVDARRSFGKPIFSASAVRVTDALDRFWNGDDLDEVADEFGVPRPDLEEALRVASSRAA